MNRIIVHSFSFIFFSFVLTSSEKYKFFPNLPAGEYEVSIKGFMPCTQPPVQNDFQFNFHLHKISANASEIRGTITHAEPLDDSYDFEVNMAIKDSIGGWKENSMVYKSKNACSTLKYFYGNAWIPFMKGLGYKNITCPIAVGNYTATGADLSLLIKYGNFPKVVFYGLYKFCQSFLMKKELRGCVLAVVNIRRPWELD